MKRVLFALALLVGTGATHAAEWSEKQLAYPLMPTELSSAVNTQGKFIAVWVDSKQMFACSSNDGSTWTSPTVVSALDDLVNSSDVSCDAQNHALIVWTTTTNVIQATQVTFGEKWAANSVTIATSASELIHNPQVFFDQTGDALVLWCNKNTLQGARYSAITKSWEPLPDLSLSNPRAANTVLFASDLSGNAWATWVTLDATTYNVQASRLIKGASSWSQPLAVFPSGSTTRLGPQIAVDAKGNATLVCQQYSVESSLQPMLAAILPINAEDWAEIASPGLTAGSIPCLQLAVDANQNVLATWSMCNAYAENKEPAPGQVFTATLPPQSSTWTSAQCLTSDAVRMTIPLLSTDTKGNAIVAWTNEDASNLNATIFSAQNGWQPNPDVLPTNGFITTPVLSPQGTAVILYLQGYRKIKVTTGTQLFQN